jgi:predicted aldo/keto reductase-like oxidoreductase
MSQQENSAITRRDFVCQAGCLAGAVAMGGRVSASNAAEPAATAAPAPEPGSLPRRILGRTKVPVTLFTLGTAPCGSFAPPRIAELVNVALDEGVNAVDTSEKYVNSQEGVGLALGKRRKDVFLSTKVFANTIAEAEASLAKSIKLLRTDHFDLLYYHSLGNLNVERALEPDGVFTWLLKQKQAGVCRFVGISGHNLPGRFARFLETGEVDVLLVTVNFVDRFTYRFEDDVLPIARKHDVGIVAMKVFGGAAGGNYKTPEGPHLDRQHLSSALRYALGTAGVATANLGIHTEEQIRENVRMVKDYQPLSSEEYASLLDLGKGLAPQWGEHFGPAKEELPS